MKLVHIAQTYIILGIVFVIPLFFLPITGDFFVLNKLGLLAILSLVGLFVWAFTKSQDDNFNFFSASLDAPVFLFTISMVVSSFVATQNKMDAFAFPGVASTLIFSSIVYFLVVQFVRDRGSYSLIVSSLAISVIAVSIVCLLSSIGLFSTFSKFLPIPSFLSGSFFSPVGSVVSTVCLFLIGLPLVFGRALQSFNRVGLNKNSIRGYVWISGFIFFIASTALTIYQLMPGKPSELTLMPFGTSWSIALETLKQSPLFGVGVGDFVEAFNRFRPVEYNSTSVWNLTFASSTNWYLEVFTVGGVVSFAFLIWILSSLRKTLTTVFKTGGANDPTFVKVSLIILVILFLFTSPSISILVVLFILFGLVSSESSKSLGFTFAMLGEARGNKNSGINLAAILIGLVALGGLLYVGYFGGKIYVADVYYRKALTVFANKGKYKDVIDHLIRAISLNPKSDFYRMDYAQISLSLMEQVVGKKELTDEDKKDVSTLVQVAIEQGKAAVSLNPTRSGNWAALGRIYRTIMPIVKGADEWTIASFRQAVSLEPTNPNLRLNLGAVFYSLQQYDFAISNFELAVAAKPDLANAHYNLAIALREAGKIERASVEMQQTVSLLKEGTRDYDLAKEELEKLNKQVKEKAEAATASAQLRENTTEQPPLEAPQPASPPVVTPGIELPESAQPPEAAN